MEFRVSNIVKTVYSDTILPLKQFYACLDSIVVVLVIVFVRCTRAVLFSLAFVFCLSAELCKNFSTYFHKI